jgi:formylglycine-generating enzyme required for sulfatase activity
MKYLKIIALLLCSVQTIEANNVDVTNLSVDQASQKATFTLSWENSWNLTTLPNNFDAIWVFVKFRQGGVWSHGLLSTTPANHTLSSSLAIASLTDAIGIMIRRSTNGNGTINSNNSVTLQLTNLPTSTMIELVQVYAIEMVQIPAGSFSVGDNSTSDSSFTNNTIASENLIAANTLRPSGLTLTGQSGAVPAAFPKGFDEFYIMKYEISAGQYTAFLNTLTRTQQVSRVGTDISVSGTITNINVMRQTSTSSGSPKIMCPASLPNTTDPVFFTCLGIDKACEYLGYADVAAYLDWAGLRPVTELEFEKACRGNAARVSGEYPWGNALIFSNASTINLVNNNTPSETLSDCDPLNNPSHLGVAAYQGKGIASGQGQLPLRCGFPGAAATSRSLMGAGFYGVMEMGGNCNELVVNVSNASGLTFTGVNGDGVVSTTGNANASLWPSVTTCNGIGEKGGDYNAVSGRVRTSDRALINLTTNSVLNSRSDGTGGRGGR